MSPWEMIWVTETGRRSGKSSTAQTRCVLRQSRRGAQTRSVSRRGSRCDEDVETGNGALRPTFNG
jgi:hypothetical protein